MAVVSADGVLSLHRIKRDSNSSSQFQQERAENQQSLQPPSPRTIDILDTKTPSKSTDVNSLLLREIHEQVRSHCSFMWDYFSADRYAKQNRIPIVGRLLGTWIILQKFFPLCVIFSGGGHLQHDARPRALRRQLAWSCSRRHSWLCPRDSEVQENSAHRHRHIISRGTSNQVLLNRNPKPYL